MPLDAAHGPWPGARVECGHGRIMDRGGEAAVWSGRPRERDESLLDPLAIERLADVIVVIDEISAAKPLW